MNSLFETTMDLPHTTHVYKKQQFLASKKSHSIYLGMREYVTRRQPKQTINQLISLEMVTFYEWTAEPCYILT